MGARKILFDISEVSNNQLEQIGVYKIINTITGDFYVGSTNRRFKERFKEHSRTYELWKLGKKTKNHNSILWNAYDKYGIGNFKIVILNEMTNSSDKQVLLMEEYYILTLLPKYNICLYPTLSGCPNKGRRLSEEWKENIAKKSRKYKHSKESLQKVSNNNKQNAIKLKFTNKNNNSVLMFKSKVSASKYFGISTSLIHKHIVKGFYKEYIIEKLSLQSKKIKVLLENSEIIFNSYGECDRYFNMWRGYTSTLINKKTSNKLIIDKYKYKLI